MPSPSQIEDNGCGIDDAIKERILNPFFSTKITKSNIGLGLTISNKIIEEFNGTLSFMSETCKGTTFIVDLPEKDPPRV
ncbi:ATP-binding protein [Oceanispirochaeta sp.]|uniref:ATP-binding protein n=1 Tax=Oceanispirochaeta sp. TaxID=2035350 RepID=UPI00345D02ED